MALPHPTTGEDPAQTKLSVSMQKVRVEYGEEPNRVVALDDLDLDVRRGDFVVILGPSGSGKTTLLNVASGLQVPTSGAVCIGGTDITQLRRTERTRFRRRNIGVVFQAYNLVPTLTAAENAGLPLRLDGMPMSAVRRAIEPLMEEMGLAGKGRRYPGELSGGEQQRIAIVRAFSTKPQVILADEPTGSLDSKMGSEVLAALRDACSRHGTTVLLSTHDRSSTSHADRVIELKDGRIAEDTSIQRAQT